VKEQKTNKVEITFEGKWVSSNQLRNNHWRKNQGLKESFRKTFCVLLEEAGMSWMERFGITVYYNSRLDTDNVTGGLKFLIDTMKNRYVADDNKKYFRRLCIEPDESLPKNTYIIIIEEI